ncbi:hypothetical protein SAMN03159496_04750 [Rhizobium sp. NFR07]|nr:hypothetical protein SAMN03159496_04750 [Rhizobium sp. NFR07]
MRLLRITASLALVATLCILLGYQTALWTGGGGFYTCQDVGCPFMLMFVSGPLFKIGYLLTAGAIFFIRRRVRR